MIPRYHLTYMQHIAYISGPDNGGKSGSAVSLGLSHRSGSKATFHGVSSNGLSASEPFSLPGPSPCTPLLLRLSSCSRLCSLYHSRLSPVCQGFPAGFSPVFSCFFTLFSCFSSVNPKIQVKKTFCQAFLAPRVCVLSSILLQCILIVYLPTIH